MWIEVDNILVMISPNIYENKSFTKSTAIMIMYNNFNFNYSIINLLLWK